VTLARVRDWSYFGQVVEAGFHQRALRMVEEGAVDGSAIDCQVLAVELRKRPELAERIRVVESLGPSPIQPVVVRSSLDAGSKSELVERLLGLRGAGLESYFVERFAAPPSYAAVAAELSRHPRPDAPVRSGG
jgi:phosphonate transport system substrate-binding protein